MNHGSQDLSKQEMEKGLIPEAATSNVSLSGWAQFKLIMVSVQIDLVTLTRTLTGEERPT